jgi:hypothetical protein
LCISTNDGFVGLDGVFCRWLFCHHIWTSEYVHIAAFVAFVDAARAENAAIDIYNALGGASWTYRANWLVGNDICDWAGIICGNSPIGEAVVAMYVGRLCRWPPQLTFYFAAL